MRSRAAHPFRWGLNDPQNSAAQRVQVKGWQAREGRNLSRRFARHQGQEIEETATATADRVMEYDLANMILGGITAGLVIVLGFVLGVLWASKWE